jgi:hypothetical protein
MIVLLWWVAGVALRRRPVGTAWQARAAMAAAALVVVLLAETALGVAFSASGLAVARAVRSPAEQAVGLVPLLWMVALPMLPGLGRSGR